MGAFCNSVLPKFFLLAHKPLAPLTINTTDVAVSSKMASCAIPFCTTGLPRTSFAAPRNPTATPVEGQILTTAPGANSFSIARLSVAALVAAGSVAIGQTRRAGPSQRKLVATRARGGDGPSMNVAYVFATNMSSTFKLAQMILPQLESGNHGAKVAGMMFFDDNIFCLKKGDPVGERLVKVAKENGMLLMVCDQCAIRRNLANGTMEQCGSGEVGFCETSFFQL